MTDIEKLLAIEEIKKLKAKYFFYFDAKDWAKWKAEVWAPDARLDVPESGVCYDGVDNLIAWASKMAGKQVSTHHGHMPIIDITSDTTATGIWAMEDILRRAKDDPLPGNVTLLHGFGHYHEQYVKLPQGWRIKSTRLTRQHVAKT